MANDLVINGQTYSSVEAVALTDSNGNTVQYYPDAVRYVSQELTEDQKSQARANIGVTGTGSDGKSAYQYAQEGGYTGTEAAFAEKLAAEIPSVDSTLTQSGQAADAQAVGDAINRLSDEVENLGGNTVSLTGKRLSILGDSISTYTGNIPDGYETFYTPDNLPSVTDTWWKKVCDRLGMVLLVNNSYSGSCVAKRPGVTIPSGSETVRNMALDDGENAPDIIIVEMGTNDFLVSVGVGSYAVSSKETFDAYSFKGAYAKMLWNILNRYPNSKLYCATIMPLIQNKYDGLFPTSHSEGGIEAYNNAIKEIAEMFGVQILNFNECGITAANLENTTVDGRIHPNADGHTMIANYAVKELAKFSPVLAAYINTDSVQDSTGGGDSGGDTDSGTLLHSFDFTTGEIKDSVGGMAVTASKVTVDENGAMFASQTSEIDVDAVFNARGKTYVLEFGEMDGSALVTTTFYARWAVFTMGTNTFRADYFTWNTDLGKWAWCSAADVKFSFDGTVNDLSNGTLKIVVETDGSAAFYLNDVLKYEYPQLISSNSYIGIGASDLTYSIMTVKKFEIYSNAV